MAAIFGCRGLQLENDERQLFSQANPLGLILFQRNCDNPEQVRQLVEDFRDCVGCAHAPVLIDQEGGRVQRLKPPHWRDAPAAARFAELAVADLDRAVQAARLNARLIAIELAELGITVNCAPVLDIAQAGADPVIGDRSCGGDPVTVAALGQAVCQGFLDAGVLPVIKHIPGHGRAGVDSHKALPRVSATGQDLSGLDFAPFAALAHMPWAMTAHVLYDQIDAHQPATTSAKVIDVIRREIGFTGILLSDDLSMQALSGTMAERSRDALAAGCDIVLHCNGKMDEMTEIAKACPVLSGVAVERLQRAETQRLEDMSPGLESIDEMVLRLNALLKEGASIVSH